MTFIKSSPHCFCFRHLLRPLGKCGATPLQVGIYSQTFDTFPASGRNPFPSWEGYTGATATSLGSVITNISGTPRAWSDTGGAVKNVSSLNIPSTSTAAEQTANPNRALALRQVNIFGDPGVSLNFNFSTIDLNVQSISLDALMLDIAATTRSTTINIQFGIGSAPTSFTNLGTWEDPGVLGSTTFTFGREDFGSALDGQSSIWFRFAAISPSAGTGSIRDLIAIDNFSIATQAVPEPSTFALIGLGALGTIMAIRRRRRPTNA